MGYIANNLVGDEKIVFTTKFHWWMWLSDIFLIVVALFIFVSIRPTSQISSRATAQTLDATSTVIFLLTPLLCIAGMASGMLNLIAWNSSEIGVTTRRIMIKRGILRRRISEMYLTQFEACQLSESLIGRLLGYKTITLHGTGGTQYRYTLVPQANRLRDCIAEVVSTSNRRQSQSQQPQYYHTPPQRTYDNPLSDLPPDEPAARIREVTNLIKTGRKPEAVQVVKELMQTHPHSADVWYLVGYLQSDPSKKRAAYERALSINPNHKQAQAALSSL